MNLTVTYLSNSSQQRAALQLTKDAIDKYAQAKKTRGPCHASLASLEIYMHKNVFSVPNSSTFSLFQDMSCVKQKSLGLLSRILTW